jgi:hypothetical protein
MDFGFFSCLTIAIETHSLQMFCAVERSTAAYFVNALFVMLWEIQVQLKYKGEVLNDT